MKAVAIITALVMSVGAAMSAPALEFEPFWVTVDAIRVTSDTTAEMRLTLTIGPRHYVYQDQMSAKVISPEGVSLEELVMPPPIVKEDPFLKKQVKIYKGTSKFTAKLKIPGRAEVEGKELVLRVGYQGCSKDLCFMPTSVELRASFGAAALSTEAGVSPPQKDESVPLYQNFGVVGLPALRFTDSAGREYKGDRINGLIDARKLRDVITKVASGNGSYEGGSPFEASLVSFLLVFVGGLLLTLTPCVWPMIPITTSIVLGSKKPGTGMGLMLSGSYVLGLAVVYAILGTVIASAGGLVGSSRQSPDVLGAVSALFVAMALSMFGVYDLPLVNLGAGKFGGGGGAASFVLGGISALLLSPCVGPVVATLLMYVATTGNAALGASLLFVFGLGMGAPLIAIGTFSGAMQKLPKSGAWMLEVKKLFGVLLGGFGVYFLFPLLSIRQEWLVSGIVAVLVGLGLIIFDVRKNLASGIAKAKLVICCIMITAGVLAAVVGPQATKSDEGIQWLDSMKDAREAAAKQGKPMMIDFSAEWCVACKEMDAGAFSDEEVVRATEGVIPVRVDLTWALKSSE